MSDDDFADDTPVTPIIDEGFMNLAKEINWRAFDGIPPGVVVCHAGHAAFRSQADLVPELQSIISQKPCPTCGSHQMRSYDSAGDPVTAAGEIDPDQDT